VPTCRGILALDMHHLYRVSDGGGDKPSNLIALCPTCHALYHRGTIKQESLYAYKAMLVAIGRAFDLEAIDRLLFLDVRRPSLLVISGDGVLQFARLIAAGLVDAHLLGNNNFLVVTYTVSISAKGRLLIDAWKQGDRSAISSALSRPVPAEEHVTPAAPASPGADDE